MRVRVEGQQRVTGIDAAGGFMDVACNTRDLLKLLLEEVRGMRKDNAELKAKMDEGIAEAKLGRDKADEVKAEIAADRADRVAARGASR